jgi:hypothetical protein
MGVGLIPDRWVAATTLAARAFEQAEYALAANDCVNVHVVPAIPVTWGRGGGWIGRSKPRIFSRSARLSRNGKGPRMLPHSEPPIWWTG